MSTFLIFFMLLPVQVVEKEACTQYTILVNEKRNLVATEPTGATRILAAARLLDLLREDRCRDFPATHYSLALVEAFARMEAASTTTEWRQGLALIDSLLAVPTPDDRYPYRRYLFEYRARILYDSGETWASVRAYAEALRLDSLRGTPYAPPSLMLLGYSAEPLAEHAPSEALCRVLRALEVKGPAPYLRTFRAKMHGLAARLELQGADKALCLGTTSARSLWVPLLCIVGVVVLLGITIGFIRFLAS